MFMLWTDTVLLLKVTALSVAIFLSYDDIGMAYPGLSLIGLLCYCPKHNQLISPHAKIESSTSQSEPE